MLFRSGLFSSGGPSVRFLTRYDGEVIDVQSNEWGYGNMVILDHGYGYKTRYAHLNKPAVRKGQKVKRGDVVGYIGATGKATGVHLHYEVLKNDKQIDPINFLYGDLSPDKYSQVLRLSTLPTPTMD